MHGIKIGQREVDGYVNATALCKAHFEATGQRRDVSEWASNQRTQESIEHLSLKTGIPVIKLVESKPGRYGGTWIHPKLAIRFAIWLSDDFGYQVEEWVLPNRLLVGSVPTPTRFTSPPRLQLRVGTHASPLKNLSSR